MTHAVGWRDGDDGFLAFGQDPEHLPVYGVTGAVKSPDALATTSLRWPDCLHLMPYAEPVFDLKRVSKAQTRRWRKTVVTRESHLGP